MKQAIVQCDCLSKSYPVPDGEPLSILADVDWEIEEGVLAAVCGQSGCGKSTLLNILGLLDRQTSGRLIVAGIEFGSERNNAAMAEHRAKNLGFIFQQHHLIDEFTAIQNVMAAEFIRGRTKNEAQKNAEKIMRALFTPEEISSGLFGRHPGKLSGGQCQRVAIARALVGNPKLVLADEPTGNLDEASADQVFDIFLKLQKDLGISVIMATHNLIQAKRADAAYWIHGGKITIMDDQFKRSAKPPAPTGVWTKPPMP
jgi:lipoprotein-releasing system ATP-binding protein